ncbi:MAG: putative ABC transporter permease [Candidatus Saccharibacteria bacterium]|nr:putative ABC transporter permease [Candidatus Saccharibacteria bacterium]
MVATSKTYKNLYKIYLKRSINLKLYQKLGIFFLVVVISGFAGWCYEVLVALLENGSFYMRGGNLLPWINIYAIGALLIIPTTYKFRQNPLIVFLFSALVTGALELFAGWLIYTITGSRLWNYDHDIWLIGSIDGHVCLLSILIFGIFSLALVYLIVPALIILSNHLSRHTFLVLAITLFSLVMIDELTNLCLSATHHPTAVDFYKSHGIKYSSKNP